MNTTQRRIACAKGPCICRKGLHFHRRRFCWKGPLHQNLHASQSMSWYLSWETTGVILSVERLPCIKLETLPPHKFNMFPEWLHDASLSLGKNRDSAIRVLSRGHAQGWPELLGSLSKHSVLLPPRLLGSFHAESWIKVWGMLESLPEWFYFQTALPFLRSLKSPCRVVLIFPPIKLF